MNPIPYGRQNITQDDIDAVVAVLKSDFLTQGPAISEFEKAFANYVGVRYAVAVSNGTAALHLAALALNVKPNDKVITTPITFAASANCIRYCGGEVVFADIDPHNYCLDIKKVEELLAQSPYGTYKGIIPVDFAGYPVNMEELRKLADRYGLWIIEDACHAPGGFFIDSNGQKQLCGNGLYSDITVFSFHPVKHIACGEGGMITTNNEVLYKKIQLLRTHGITKDPGLLHDNHGGWYYEMQELGYNYRLTDIQAALGNSQLKKADEGLNRRREIANIYKEAFKDKSYIIGQSGFVEGHAYHLYVIEVENRKGLHEFLRDNNIFAQIHYIPVHTMPYYKQFGWNIGDLPVAEKYYSCCISLPMYPTLTDDEQVFVIKTINEFYA
ncbi:MAG: UDP-4-amino-4,6-dideoxy-N-acetyl-beta-L-altrosamine transaminase [Marinilabiliaceae bacterium]|nr:UDP-4-amino-4,6-dideoxy-N-acetyl-beta-L-altrosamine transaminase [Marinilabiliaceae bacterium]